MITPLCTVRAIVPVLVMLMFPGSNSDLERARIGVPIPVNQPHLAGQMCEFLQFPLWFVKEAPRGLSPGTLTGFGHVFETNRRGRQ